MPIVRNTFHLQAVRSSEDDEEYPVVRVAAIGLTTSAFLQERLHLRVDVVPHKPNAKDLAAAIAEYDRQNYAKSEL
jgi:uroporphyrinogen-III synthase